MLFSSRGMLLVHQDHHPFNLHRGKITNPDATIANRCSYSRSQALTSEQEDNSSSGEMQGIAQAIRFHGSRLRQAVLYHLGGRGGIAPYPKGSTSGPKIPNKGLENTTVADLLKGTKGERDAGEAFWCNTTDTVYDAVKHMTDHNIGALVVVKPGEKKLIAGIVTERDYLRKIIVHGRSSKSTCVGEIMTDENKLITVSSDTSILQAMELMTEKRIRHIPVIDAQVVGMVSIVDVVGAVVDQHHQEVQRLNDFIRGEYY